MQEAASSALDEFIYCILLATMKARFIRVHKCCEWSQHFQPGVNKRVINEMGEGRRRKNGGANFFLTQFWTRYMVRTNIPIPSAHSISVRSPVLVGSCVHAYRQFVNKPCWRRLGTKTLITQRHGQA
jgi:hypothetical protein